MDVLDKVVRDAIADVMCSSAEDSDKLPGDANLAHDLGLDSLDFHELRFCLEQHIQKRTGREFHLHATVASTGGTVTVSQVTAWVRTQLAQANIELPETGRKS